MNESVYYCEIMILSRFNFGLEMYVIDRLNFPEIRWVISMPWEIGVRLTGTIYNSVEDLYFYLLTTVYINAAGMCALSYRKNIIFELNTSKRFSLLALAAIHKKKEDVV